MIIFTGVNYWKLFEAPGVITNDFKVVAGYRWIKATKSWSAKTKLFFCPKHYQILTEAEAKAQGLI